MTDRECDGFSKFAALFSVIENVVVKKTPPSTTAKNGIFMEFFVRSDVAVLRL
jgi:hypothetical protein